MVDSSSAPRLVILDRDGVINLDSDAYVKSVDEWIAIETKTCFRELVKSVLDPIRVRRSREKIQQEIAKTKMADLNANDIDAAVKIIAGTARSMGVETDL